MFCFVLSRFRSVIAKVFKERDFIFIMGWKEWSYWLKGGIIFLVLGDLLLLIYISALMGLSRSMGSAPISLYSIFLILLSILVVSLISFLFGAFIGWIVWKIKSRKN